MFAPTSSTFRGDLPTPLLPEGFRLMELPLFSSELLLLLPLAVAAGLDLYLTLLVVGLYLAIGEPLLGGPLPLPGGAWIILPGLLGLYLLEFALELRPFPALVWHNLQLFLRPLGGALLGFTLMDGSPTGSVLLGAAMAGLVAAFLHVLTWGQGLLLRLVPARSVSPLTLNLASDTTALTLVVLALEQTSLALSSALVILVLGIVLGAHLHRVVRFGTVLLRDSLWGFLSQPGWTGEEALPRWVRRWSGRPEVGGVRGIPAGGWRLPGGDTFREGWVVDASGRRSFLFRKGRRTVEIPMGGQVGEEGVKGHLAFQVELKWAEGRSSALFLQRSVRGSKPHKWEKTFDLGNQAL